MKKIVDGKVYDTKTAEEICDVTPRLARTLSTNDFGWEDTRLYRTQKGAFFIAGEGGPMTRWAQPMGQNGRTGGSGLVVVDEQEARRLVEQFGEPADFVRCFGEPEEA